MERLTVGTLRAALADMPDDSPVWLAGWEGYDYDSDLPQNAHRVEEMATGEDLVVLIHGSQAVV